MEFFKTRKMEQAYKNEIHHYLNDIAINYRLCKSCEKEKEYRSALRSELKTGIKDYRKTIRISYASLYRTIYDTKHPFHKATYACLRLFEIITTHIRK